MWPMTNLSLLELLFYSFGSLLLLREGLLTVQSMRTSIGARKKRLLALQVGIRADDLTPLETARRTEVMAKMPMENTEGIRVARSVFVLLICCAISFLAGRWQRDFQAYRKLAVSSFHSRPHVSWKVVREYAVGNRVGYDLELPGGDITPNFIPCESRGLHPGMVVTSAGFTDKGECLSFAEPGWMKIEYPNLALKGKSQ